MVITVLTFNYGSVIFCVNQVANFLLMSGGQALSCQP